MRTEQESRQRGADQRAADQRAELAQAIVAELGKIAPDATVTWPARRPHWDSEARRWSQTEFNEDRDKIDVARDGYTVAIRLSNSGRRGDGPACGTVLGAGNLRRLTNASAASLAKRALANLAEQHRVKLEDAARAEYRNIAEQRRAESRRAIEAACPGLSLLAGDTGPLDDGPLLLTVKPQATAEPFGHVEMVGMLRPDQIAALVEAVRAALGQTADVAQEA